MNNWKSYRFQISNVLPNIITQKIQLFFVKSTTYLEIFNKTVVFTNSLPKKCKRKFP